jgi:hypothetical protein
LEGSGKLDGLKLNGNIRFWFMLVMLIRILGGNVHTLKKNTEAIRVASKNTGLHINADKTKYMVMSRDQNAERSHNVKIDNSSFRRVEEFKYLSTNLTYQNSIHKEIKSRLKSRNVCYHSLQNSLYSSLLSKKFKD